MSETKAVPMPGYEDAVASLRGKLSFIKQLTDEVNFAKEAFRTAARSVVASLPAGVTVLEYMDGKGGAITVGLLDYGRSGNRKQLNGKMLTQAQELGLDLNGRTEVEECAVLTGEFLAWIKQLMSQWETQGVVLPEGFELKRTMKLNGHGVSWLQELAQHGAAGAQAFLDTALKAPSVGMK